MGKQKTLVVALYNHPEYYPPTLNALEYLSKQFDHIYIVHMCVKGFDWKYPSNVTLLTYAEQIGVREAEQKPRLYKIKSFLSFSALLRKTYNETGATALLLYDYISILAYRIMRFFMRTPEILWYHNHDVAEERYVKKGTIAWFGWKSEKWIFPKLTIFSLPAVERKQCFPMDLFRGNFFFIPNFPSKKIYNGIGRTEKSTSEVKILFQGSVAPQHGLEEIIALLSQPICPKPLKLVIKGFISNEFKTQLIDLANKHNVSGQISFLPPSGYRQVIENVYSCHIGIGIHRKEDMMNKTLGTASNKIYEYAAAGMPVLLYDNPHFRHHLDKFEWTFFTDCTEASLKECLVKICSDYERLSAQAQHDFEEQLNFEFHFNKVLAYINNAEIR